MHGKDGDGLLKSFEGKDIVSIKDLTKEEINFILNKAEFMENLQDKGNLLRGKVMASLFFEPSTRTRESFTSACIKLGGTVVGFSDVNTTSMKKGESLRDNIKMYEPYSDIVVIRHNFEGAARLAAENIKIPVINGGDGANQHPTQTLLDLYSIKKTQGKIEGLKVAIVGDLKYGRTAHSLSSALSLFGCRLYFISPDNLKMPKHIKEELDSKGIIYSEHKFIKEVIDKLDILYMTRIQEERFPDKAEYEKVKGVYVLTKAKLGGVKENLKIMHPLPRINEISTDVDSTKYAYYFQQAGNGIPVRQTLLCLVTGALNTFENQKNILTDNPEQRDGLND